MRSFYHYNFKFFLFFLVVNLSVEFNTRIQAQEGTKQFFQARNNNGELNTNPNSAPAAAIGKVSTADIILYNVNDVDETLHTYNSPAEVCKQYMPIQIQMCKVSETSKLNKTDLKIAVVGVRKKSPNTIRLHFNAIGLW